MKRIFLFALLFFAIFSPSSPINAQNSAKQKYLLENYEVLSFDKQNQFKFFDKEFYANQVFLLGEMHGTADSYRVQQLLVDELKKKTDFKYYFIELGYLQTIGVNEYLKTGNESKLNQVIETIKGGFGYSRDYRNIFTHVYELNRKLPEKDRIRFFGVDGFSPTRESFAYLVKILTDSGYKKGSQKNVDKIYTFDSIPYTYKDWTTFFADLSKDLETNKTVYRQILGDKFWEFEFLLDNFNASFNIETVRNVKPLSEQETENVRDAQMAKNFAALYQHLNLKRQKIFGFFGREHTYKDSGKRTNWMTARIKEANPHLKIVTAALRYMESQFMIPTYFLEQQFGTKQEKLYFYGGFQNDNSPFVKALGIEDLNAVAPESEAVLFRLNAKNSPYNSLPDLVDEIADGKSTTDYFDYAVLLRKSKAAIPISER